MNKYDKKWNLGFLSADKRSYLQFADRKVEKISEQVFFNLDDTICVILRDYLRKYRDIHDGTPLCITREVYELAMPIGLANKDELLKSYDEHYKMPTLDYDANEEEFHAVFNNILTWTADKFDYYLTHDVLDDEQEKLSEIELKNAFAVLGEILPYLWD